MDRYDPASDADKMQALTRLAASVADQLHKIALMLAAEAEMLAGSDAQERLATIAPLVRRTARRVEDITRGLLEFSGVSQTTPQVIAIPSALLNLTPLLQKIIDPAIDLQLTSTSDLPQVCVDVFQFEKVVCTLVSRARDAMPDGGLVAVTASRGNQQDQLAIGGECVRLEVADNGVPIPAHLLPRLFEPVLARKAYGLWLGLATVYGAVNQMNGRIAVTSIPGAGSRFTILLPASDDPARPT